MLDHDQWYHAVQSYLACVSFVDAQVGKVLDALDESGLADQTIVVLWGDHGFHLGTKDRWGKRSLWEASTRVPMLMAGPGITKNALCDRPVGLIDLYPTLAELCGLPSRTGLEGHSLVPLLKDPDADWAWPAVTSFGQHNHAVRSQNYRYIVYADGSEEFYDHRQDPNEFINLASNPTFRGIIEQHRRWLPQVNQPMAPGSKHADARPGSAPDIDGPQ
jgi:arylsulfatase A-like enzyme